MQCESSAPHHVDVTQAVDPEGVQRRCDRVQLVGLEGLLTLNHSTVESGADPALHAAHCTRLEMGKKHLYSIINISFTFGYPLQLIVQILGLDRMSVKYTESSFTSSVRFLYNSKHRPLKE